MAYVLWLYNELVLYLFLLHVHIIVQYHNVFYMCILETVLYSLLYLFLCAFYGLMKMWVERMVSGFVLSSLVVSCLVFVCLLSLCVSCLVFLFCCCGCGLNEGCEM